MDLSVSRTVELPQPLPAVWRAAATIENLPRTFGPVAPIPGVRAAEVQGGGDLAPGKVRLVHLTDGSTSREEILELQTEERHTYRLMDLPPPFSWLVRHAVSDWRFAAAGTGARIDWTYTFTLTTPLAWPFARIAVWLFGRAMDGNIAGIKRILG
jgi:hypothetical protein